MIDTWSFLLLVVSISYRHVVSTLEIWWVVGNLTFRHRLRQTKALNSQVALIAATLSHTDCFDVSKKTAEEGFTNENSDPKGGGVSTFRYSHSISGIYVACC